MTKRLLLLFIPAAFAFGLAAGRLPAQDSKAEPPADEKELKARGYALGYYIGKGRSRGVKGFVDPAAAGQGFADGIRLEGKQTDDEVEENLYGLRVAMIKKQVPAAQQEMALRQAKMERDRMAKSRVAKKAGVDYLAANKSKEGVQVTANGLQYRVLKEGTGPQPKATDTVTVHYVGKLISGKVFDSSVKRGQPASFPLNRVIRGWTEGLQLMKVGSKYEFTIPFDLAYGPGGKPPTIPPFATLVFEVELLKIGG